MTVPITKSLGPRRALEVLDIPITKTRLKVGDMMLWKPLDKLILLTLQEGKGMQNTKVYSFLKKNLDVINSEIMLIGDEVIINPNDE